jgi:hypothetical protein
MHTLHWWAVEAEDKEDAFNIVKDRLITDEGNNWVDWSDWHVVGGGRWNSEGDGYTDSSNMIISYAESPDEFKAKIDWCRNARKDEMNRCLSEIKTDKFISDIVDFISNGGIPNDDQRFSMNNYYLKKKKRVATQTLCSLWTVLVQRVLLMDLQLHTI